MSAASASTAIVFALAASDVRPSIGETVLLYASWGGELPAAVTWEGVDTQAGALAQVTPRSPGPLTVSAGGVSLTLDVQAARGVGYEPVLPPEIRSLPTVEAWRCHDDRYPTFAGPWVIGCETSGRVDVAVHVETRQKLLLSDGVESPGAGPSAVLAPGKGLWRLPSLTPEPDLVHLSESPVGPPATDGVHVAMVGNDGVEAFPLADRIRTRTDATPLPGQAAALAWPYAAWVERGESTAEDVWARNEAATRIPLARTEASERLVTGSDRWLGWVADGTVYVQDMARNERRAYAADTGFVYGPSLWGPVACWEDRAALRAGTGDIDIFCSDGMELRRPGDQRAPARWGPWLLFREDNRVMYAVARELILDDDDPRADGGPTVPGGWGGAHRDGPCSWTFDWPARGWRIERWDGAEWQPGEPLDVGRITVTNPTGDAVRLVPEQP